jgi:hypothetical protein
MRPIRPRCIWCRYDLAGTPEEEGAVCPECGRTVDWRLARTGCGGDGWRQLSLMGACFVALCVAAFLATRRDPFNIFWIPIFGAGLSVASVVCVALHYAQRVDPSGRRPSAGRTAGWVVAWAFASLSVAMTALLLWTRFVP